jgi:hypothetical protein
MGLKFSGCANDYEALVPMRNEPSVLLGARLRFVDEGSGGGEQAKNCIIMHVWGGISRKLHYNALFGGGKRREKLSTQSSQRRREKIRGRSESKNGRTVPDPA